MLILALVQAEILEKFLFGWLTCRVSLVDDKLVRRPFESVKIFERAAAPRVVGIVVFVVGWRSIRYLCVFVRFWVGFIFTFATCGRLCPSLCVLIKFAVSELGKRLLIIVLSVDSSVVALSIPGVVREQRISRIVDQR